MKVRVEEFDGCFGFNFIAENMQDAVDIVRFGLNHTKEVRNAGSNVGRYLHSNDAKNDRNFTMYITIGKRKQSESYIKGKRNGNYDLR